MAEEIDEIPDIVSAAPPRKRRMATRRKVDVDAEPATVSDEADRDDADSEPDPVSGSISIGPKGESRP